MSAERGLESAARWYDRFRRDCCDRPRTSRHSAEHLSVSRFTRRVAWVLAGALLRLMVIALARDGVASGARLAGWASLPCSPAAGAASCASLSSSTSVPALWVQPASIGGDCRSAPAAHPAIPAPGAVF